MCYLTAVLRQGRELIDVLARVLAPGHAEAELEVEALEQPLSEIVPLDHPKVFYGQVSHGELNTAPEQTCSKVKPCHAFTHKF